MEESCLHACILCSCTTSATAVGTAHLIAEMHPVAPRNQTPVAAPAVTQAQPERNQRPSGCRTRRGTRRTYERPRLLQCHQHHHHHHDRETASTAGGNQTSHVYMVPRHWPSQGRQTTHEKSQASKSNAMLGWSLSDKGRDRPSGLLFPHPLSLSSMRAKALLPRLQGTRTYSPIPWPVHGPYCARKGNGPGRKIGRTPPPERETPGSHWIGCSSTPRDHLWRTYLYYCCYAPGA